MAAVKNGREYLSHVTETLKHRIAQLDESIEVGQKEIEGMHEYYWENYTEMTSTDMRILITSRHFSMRSMPAMRRSNCVGDSGR